MKPIRLLRVVVHQDDPDIDAGSRHCLVCVGLVKCGPYAELLDGDRSVGVTCARCVSGVGVDGSGPGGLGQALDMTVSAVSDHLDRMRELLDRFDDVSWYSLANDVRLAQLRRAMFS